MEEEMYNPPEFFTVEVLSEIVAEFTWPVSYTLDDSYPDYIIVKFPKSNLCFYEGFESDMGLFFLNSDTKIGNKPNLKLFDALHYVLRPEAKARGDFKEVTLTGYSSPFASLEKVKNGIRDICILVQAYLLPCVEGDFTWVERYQVAVSKSKGAV